MSHEPYTSEIRSYLAEVFGGQAGDYAVDEPLLGELLDSMGVLTLATHLEDTYGIVVAAHEMDPANFGTLEALADFVARKKAGG